MKIFLHLLVFSMLAFSPLYAFADPTEPGTPTPPTQPGTPTPPTQPGTPTPPTEPGTPTPESRGLVNPLNNIDSLPDLLTALIDAVVQIGAIILVLAIVYVGFKFVAAQGNEEKLRDARSALVWTVIGGLILLGAEAISLVISETVGAL